MNNNQNSRLKKVREHLKMTQKAFGAILGLEQGSISEIESGKKSGIVSDDIKYRLDKEFNVNIDWLETGNGEMFKNNQSVENVQGNGIVGNNVHGGGINDSTIIDGLLSTIKKRDEHVDRLLNIIEKISSK